MNNKDKIKAVLVITALISMMLGSAYAGYKYPEYYLLQYDPLGLTRVQPDIGQKNISEYCTRKTIPFTRITTKYWCIA